MLPISHQTRYMLDKMIAAQEEDFKRHGGVRERMDAARNPAPPPLQAKTGTLLRPDPGERNVCQGKIVQQLRYGFPGEAYLRPLRDPIGRPHLSRPAPGRRSFPEAAAPRRSWPPG